MDELRNIEMISASLRQELDKLAKGGRILELNGHGDRIFGHIAQALFSDEAGQRFS